MPLLWSESEDDGGLLEYLTTSVLGLAKLNIPPFNWTSLFVSYDAGPVLYL